MDATATRYADWKAPADDGQMLIWPEPADLLADARENARRLASADHVLVQGVPLPELRAQARAFLGHDNDQLLIATGHQTELYHPGVWVKDALIDAAAQKSGGAAYHFAVDTDAPKHLHLRWPGGSRPITDDSRLADADWSAQLAAPTPQHLSLVQANLDDEAMDWQFEPTTEPFFSSLRRLSLESPNLSAALTNATHALDWELGLRHHAMVMSVVWHSEPYFAFLHHLLATARPFALAYNSALAAYRRRNGIKTAARPMPDLRIAADQVEAPFWFDDLSTGHRTRASVRFDGGTSRLVLSTGADFPLDPSAKPESARSLLAWCRHHDVRLAPRALTLTMFFRLLLADQFVHGIGGGRYDQVTDDVIHRHFGLEPPRFAVTTATLYFPAAVGQRRVNLRPLLQEGRRIRHGLLSKEKMSTVQRIDALPRRSRERQDLFFAMHRRLAAESNGPTVREWERRFRDAEHESLRQKALFDRELFFAIQPGDRLAGMIDRYRAAFA